MTEKEQDELLAKAIRKQVWSEVKEDPWGQIFLPAIVSALTTLIFDLLF